MFNITTQEQVINNTIVKTTEGRLLQHALGNTIDHTTWIKRKIASAFLTENMDYIRLHKSIKNVSGTRHIVEYHLSIASCKAIAMMERSMIGKQVRDYYTALELQAQKQLPQSHIEAVRAYLTTLEKVEEQQSQIKQQIETISSKASVIDYKKIITADSKDYYPISYVKDKYPSAKLSGRKLGIASGEMDLPPIPMFASKGCIPINTYHSSVWFEVYPNYPL